MAKGLPRFGSHLSLFEEKPPAARMTAGGIAVCWISRPVRADPPHGVVGRRPHDGGSSVTNLGLDFIGHIRIILKELLDGFLTWPMRVSPMENQEPDFWTMPN